MGIKGKSWLIGKDSDAGRDWGQEEKGTTKDEMAGWHHWLDGHEFRWTPEVGDGQGGLACCNSRGRKESDTTERPNWTELKRETGRFYIVWALKSLWMVIAASKLKHTCSLEEKLWKSWCWNWSSNTSATWCKRPTHWKRPWCWEDWRQEERGQQRMRWLNDITDSMDMSLSNSGRQWRTGKPGVLQSMGSQRVRHNLATEKQQFTNDNSEKHFTY